MIYHLAGGINFGAGEWPLDPGRATLVFIHGAGGTGDFWRAQVEMLSHRFNTVALDLPGHGRSDGEGQERIEGYAAVVAGFIETIAAPMPIPCGFSMGGAICLQILLDYPERAAAGILINTGATMKVGQIIFERIEKDYHGFVDYIGSLATGPRADPDAARIFKESFSHVQAETTLADFNACNTFDVRERLASIGGSVLIITADSDKLMPAHHGDVLEQGIRHSRRAHIRQAGHIAPLEKPDEINGVILQFLEPTDQSD